MFWERTEGLFAIQAATAYGGIALCTVPSADSIRLGQVDRTDWSESLKGKGRQCANAVWLDRSNTAFIVHNLHCIAPYFMIFIMVA